MHGAVFVGDAMKKDYSNEPWWNALNREQREQVVAYLEEHGELEEPKEVRKQESTKYRNMFGWG